MFANLTDRSWSLLFLFYYTTETHFIEQFRVYGLFLDCPAEVTLRTGSTLSLAFQIIQWAVLISVEGNGRVSGSVVLVLVVLVSCFSQTRGEWWVETAAVKLIIVFSVAGANSPSLPRSIYFYPILVPWVPEYLPAYLAVFLLHIYHRWSIIVLYWYCIAIKQALYYNSLDSSDQ